jgi:hypothetical protein
MQEKKRKHRKSLQWDKRYKNVPNGNHRAEEHYNWTEKFNRELGSRLTQEEKGISELWNYLIWWDKTKRNEVRVTTAEEICGTSLSGACTLHVPLIRGSEIKRVKKHIKKCSNRKLFKPGELNWNPGSPHDTK